MKPPKKQASQKQLDHLERVRVKSLATRVERAKIKKQVTTPAAPTAPVTPQVIAPPIIAPVAPQVRAIAPPIIPQIAPPVIYRQPVAPPVQRFLTEQDVENAVSRALKTHTDSRTREYEERKRVLDNKQKSLAMSLLHR